MPKHKASYFIIYNRPESPDLPVNEGKIYYCNKFKKAQKHLQQQNDVPSQRELQVLQLIASGLSTKEIAQSLIIAENTVENHRKSLFRKMKARNMAELIIRAIANGYINPVNIADTTKQT